MGGSCPFEQRQILQTIALQLQTNRRQWTRYAEAFARINECLPATLEMEPRVRTRGHGQPADEPVYTADPGTQRVQCDCRADLLRRRRSTIRPDAVSAILQCGNGTWVPTQHTLAGHPESNDVFQLGELMLHRPTGVGAHHEV